MATSITIDAASGYPTKTSMRVDVSFTVTYAASYNTEFEVRRGSKTGTLVDSATGSTFAMSANSSKSGIYKTFSGLSPGTRYTIIVYLSATILHSRLRLISSRLLFTTQGRTPGTRQFGATATSRTAMIYLPLRLDSPFMVGRKALAHIRGIMPPVHHTLLPAVPVNLYMLFGEDMRAALLFSTTE